MKLIVTTVVIAVALVISFFISLDWAMGIDYTPVEQSVVPLAVTWLVGVFAFASLGGIVGAVLDYRDQN
jgi:hypothetical protein